MVQRLSEALEIPFRKRNSFLLSAGFAPAYRESRLDDDRLKQVKSSLELLLERHEPYPAFVLDRFWNIVMSNHAHDRIMEGLFADRERQGRDNAIRLVLDPNQLRPLIGNWAVVARTVMSRFERQYQASGQDEDLLRFRAEMLAYPEVEGLLENPHEPDHDAILIPMELEIGGVQTSWFTTLATFGAPLDVTLQEAVIESLFPADEVTESFSRSMTGQSR